MEQTYQLNFNFEEPEVTMQEKHVKLKNWWARLGCKEECIFAGDVREALRVCMVYMIWFLILPWSGVL